MNIVIAPDSFKGSLTAGEICNIASQQAHNVFADCNVTSIPMADGGEGTVDCLVRSMNGEYVECSVRNPLNRVITAKYGRFGNNAIIEMSAASGITLVTDDERDILKQSTYGTGELILHALESGINNIFLGIGGSATNDAGIGFASAIGVRFLDCDGNVLEAVPYNFNKIHSIDASGINPLIKKAHITVMCDVTNPLLGENGATNIFGPQKGADEDTRKILEKGINNYINIAENTVMKSVRNSSGAGAAGGLGSALSLYTDAHMCSGIETILKIVDFEDKIKDADLVVTGEGRMDYQSAFGKVASGIGKVCMKHNVPCVAIVGSMGERAEEMSRHGITSIISTVNSIMTLDNAVSNARELYESAARRTFALVKAGLTISCKHNKDNKI